MTYYDQIQYLAAVNEQDEIIDKVEKWEAHKKGILHRCFTIGFMYKDQYVLQHRKHIAFDGYLDLTIASHQLYNGLKIEDDLVAIYKTMLRELTLKPNDLVHRPKYLGGFVYTSEDKRGGFIEHEFNRLYLAELRRIPKPNLEFAYGYSLVSKTDLYNAEHPIRKILTPWTVEALERSLV